ncbi:hypothetical protein PsorP6_008657 [Peronosclerospora sorghi]|uniref:Uncharacterized protein n=1 Tax=Peronosclerospora sorghi TaxID=230839 RepID=A0ACC0WD47_9STRA|nr:hypothetical protein PsorP6_008657 [Peronosclerospora sorghi]
MVMWANCIEDKLSGRIWVADLFREEASIAVDTSLRPRAVNGPSRGYAVPYKKLRKKLLAMNKCRDANPSIKRRIEQVKGC